jgi:hypothetical protein
MCRRKRRKRRTKKKWIGLLCLKSVSCVGVLNNYAYATFFVRRKRGGTNELNKKK